MKVDSWQLLRPYLTGRGRRERIGLPLLVESIVTPVLVMIVQLIG